MDPKDRQALIQELDFCQRKIEQLKHLSSVARELGSEWAAQDYDLRQLNERHNARELEKRLRG